MNTPFPSFLRKLSVIALFAAVSAIANAQSPISMDGTTGAGTGTTQNFDITGANQTITINGDGPNANGTINGSNLFFSFSQFGIAAGDTALFQCPGGCSGVTNVIGRVTGGSSSNFDGTLTSTIGTANFWFFNPFGINFNVNAVVNVPVSASYSISNASGVNFSNGAVFEAVNFGSPGTDPTISTLTSATPASFGFGAVYDGQENLITSPYFFKTGTNTPPAVTIPVVTTPDVTTPAASLSLSPEDNNTVVISLVQPVKPVVGVAALNNVTTLQLPNNSCDSEGQSTLNSRGVAGYIPELGAQVPTSVLSTMGSRSLASIERTAPLTLATAADCP
jgi:filamentous hemagglutinin family protein